MFSLYLKICLVSNLKYWIRYKEESVTHAEKERQSIETIHMPAAIHGVSKSWTRLSDWTELNKANTFVKSGQIENLSTNMENVKMDQLEILELKNVISD